MTKQEFKDKQIEIFDKEVQLADITHKTLFDMLESLSEEENEKFIDTDHYVDGCNEIITNINTKCFTTQNEDTGEFLRYDLESLSQVQQKEIIDAIIINVWNL